MVTVGAQDPASGLRALTLVLTACGGEPYSVDGYGAVAQLGADQQALDVALQTAGGVPARGRRSSARSGAVVVHVDSGTDGVRGARVAQPGAEGEAVTAQQVSVVPGPGRAAQVVDLLVDPGDTGQVRLTVWQAGLPG